MAKNMDARYEDETHDIVHLDLDILEFMRVDLDGFGFYSLVLG
jgi:hypothetical protein